MLSPAWRSSWDVAPQNSRIRAGLHSSAGQRRFHFGLPQDTICDMGRLKLLDQHGQRFQIGSFGKLDMRIDLDDEWFAWVGRNCRHDAGIYFNNALKRGCCSAPAIQLGRLGKELAAA